MHCRRKSTVEIVCGAPRDIRTSRARVRGGRWQGSQTPRRALHIIGAILMPWALFALLAGAGGLYYATNKGRATNVRWELHFPASSALLLSSLIDAVTP